MFIFSDRIVFQRNGIRGESTVCISFFHSLFFSLLLFDTSPHFVLFSIPPPGSLRKARDQEQGHCLGDDKHPCFGVSVSFHARSLGGRHFGRCLFNQVWRTTRSLGRLNLPPPHLLSSPQVTW